MENHITPHSQVDLTIDPTGTPERIDKYLALQFPSHSRAFFARMIDSNCVTLNGKPVSKHGVLLKPHDVVRITFPHTPTPEAVHQEAKNLDIKLVHEHPHFFILAKGPDVVVHKPNSHSSQATLVDWLMANHTEITGVGYGDRPGIVHRLDKDTSGLLVIARTNHAHATLSAMFKQRTITKTYLALVHGHPSKQGTITLPIGRHPIQRTKMAAFGGQHRINARNAHTVRSAFTEYEVVQYFKDYSLVRVNLLTGRTHQIRVHFAAIGHPIVGDTVYGTTSQLINRQALHAHALHFVFDAQQFDFINDIPTDFATLLNNLDSI